MCVFGNPTIKIPDQDHTDTGVIIVSNSATILLHYPQQPVLIGPNELDRSHSTVQTV